MTTSFSRDSKGIEEILKSGPVAQAVRDVANEIASHVKSQGGSNTIVDVNEYETDRAAASVLLAGGAARQARDGALTRAAAAAGLEVHAE